ncbi:hypothetical protein [Luteirhabdus pelagi]|uniref:hypothetical protein n=1 Tax=Luteirhabdus pelagi TaxID=2792783 RepID=UPI00193AACA4|nr:hypothetical protein [Luteirhabdus pelagi]
MKKYVVLSILFILPIAVYMFFATGVNNFAKLPVLSKTIEEPTAFKTAEGEAVTLKDHITVLAFMGRSPMEYKIGAYNLAHKIFKKNEGFEEFQFLFIYPKAATEDALTLENKVAEIASTERWISAFGSEKDIISMFQSLKVPYSLENNTNTPYVFIIDKEGNLRGRNDDEDVGMMYGYNAMDIAEINNKMSDDVKVLLAEYRRALKKYKADR